MYSLPTYRCGLCSPLSGEEHLAPPKLGWPEVSCISCYPPCSLLVIPKPNVPPLREDPQGQDCSIGAISQNCPQHPQLGRVTDSWGFHLGAEEQPALRTPDLQGHPCPLPDEAENGCPLLGRVGCREKARLCRPDNEKGYFQLWDCLPHRKVNWLLLIFQ